MRKDKGFFYSSPAVRLRKVLRKRALKRVLASILDRVSSLMTMVGVVVQRRSRGALSVQAGIG